MKRIFILILICYGCTNTSKTKKDGNSTVRANKQSLRSSEDKKTLLSNKNRIKGIWSNGQSENATFEIREDSIYYVEHFESYKYAVNKDSIKIYYPDFTYSAKIYFIKDTMVMSSKEDGISKFWRFKN